MKKDSKNSFEIFDRFVSGIVLEGDEVKSIKKGSYSIKESFILERKEEIFVKNLWISPYTKTFSKDPRRERKLLLKKNEIRKISNYFRNSNLSSHIDQIILDNKFIKVSFFIVKRLRIYRIKQKEKEKEIEKKILKKNFS